MLSAICYLTFQNIEDSCFEFLLHRPFIIINVTLDIEVVHNATAKHISRLSRIVDVSILCGRDDFRSFFTDKIGEGGLYLLDEPENSLSPENQVKLAQFIEDSTRFYDCQFVIATHSPFLLALKGARVYDLDADPAAIRKWTELPNVRAYYEFFKANAAAFE